jgi:non-heme chloroperoxidase
MTMSTITTTDSTEIYCKGWGTGQPIVFHHGWPPSGGDRDAQMLFFPSKGYRVIAHNLCGRRGGDAGASGLAECRSHRHPTGGGEVVRYVARHGGNDRVSRAVLIGAVPR